MPSIFVVTGDAVVRPGLVRRRREIVSQVQAVARVVLRATAVAEASDVVKVAARGSALPATNAVSVVILDVFAANV
jgi:hypothetical protein